MVYRSRCFKTLNKSKLKTLKMHQKITDENNFNALVRDNKKLLNNELLSKN